MYRFIFAFILTAPLVSQADDITLLADPWCPYTCDAKGGDKGALIELTEKALPNHKVIYKNEGWARALAVVKNGGETAVAGAGTSDAVDFTTSSKGEMSTENCFYAPKGSAWKFNGVDSVKSINLGVINGYKYEDKMDQYLDTKPKNVDVYAGDDDGTTVNLKKLAGKRIDAYLDDTNVIAYNAKKLGLSDQIQPAGCLGKDNMFIGFSKKNPKSATYAKELEEGVKKLKASGEFDKILSKYGIK